MKKIIYSLLLISSVTFAQTERFVGDFTKVTSFDQIDVELVLGTENKVILKGTNSEEVELINNNGELKIRMSLAKMLSGDAISATVYYKKLDALEANEGSRISCETEIKAIGFDIITKEVAEIVLNILSADKLKIRCGAGSIVTIKGIVKNQDILANSGAKYDGQDCITQQTTVTVNAGGIANVNVSDIVDAKTRAGGTIIIYGNPKQINQKSVAGGKIIQAK
ncbi:head GIN domain-containing protein [Flavobacterium sp.]|uniref:head GIN domain-containing protein n=1 Tax=Flavobacterium sp. TaxID=239 RepID=UPI00333F76D1